ncbi:MAG: NYN domain-containing protein [Gammaproteobacteria bacterium]
MEKHNDTSTARVALLIDADNFSSHYATELFNKAAVYGHVIVRKAYGVMTTGFAWKPEVLHRHAIEPVVRFHYVSGKNVSDFALVIDAMELMRLQTVDAICIASNDSDFSLLAMKLRENGIKVYGFGDKASAKSFIASCDEYTRLSLPEEPLLPAGQTPPDSADAGKPAATDTAGQSPVAPANVEKSATTDITGIKKIISDACDSLDGDDAGWIYLGGVTTYLKRVDAAFTPKQYGFGKMLALVESMCDTFEVRHDKKKLTVHIRKKAAKNSKKAK